MRFNSAKAWVVCFEKKYQNSYRKNDSIRIAREFNSRMRFRLFSSRPRNMSPERVIRAVGCAWCRGRDSIPAYSSPVIHPDTKGSTEGQNSPKNCHFWLMRGRGKGPRAATSTGAATKRIRTFASFPANILLILIQFCIFDDIVCVIDKCFRGYAIFFFIFFRNAQMF